GDNPARKTRHDRWKLLNRAASRRAGNVSNIRIRPERSFETISASSIKAPARQRGSATGLDRLGNARKQNRHLGLQDISSTCIVPQVRLRKPPNVSETTR